jgi:hypothetical protein
MRLYGLTQQLKDIKPELVIKNPQILQTFIDSYWGTTHMLNALITEKSTKVYYLFHTYTVERYCITSKEGATIPGST